MWHATSQGHDGHAMCFRPVCKERTVSTTLTWGHTRTHKTKHAISSASSQRCASPCRFGRPWPVAPIVAWPCSQKHAAKGPQHDGPKVIVRVLVETLAPACPDVVLRCLGAVRTSCQHAAPRKIVASLHQIFLTVACNITTVNHCTVSAVNIQGQTNQNKKRCQTRADATGLADRG